MASRNNNFKQWETAYQNLRHNDTGTGDDCPPISDTSRKEAHIRTGVAPVIGRAPLDEPCSNFLEQQTAD